ncbi:MULTISPECIES: class F sortase [Bacillus]|uniref:Peptidase C60 n=1 Tax=Bacillus zhangzhouensis TaxID=1178540 RepID=A0A081LAH1_9BACI|nr:MULTISPECIES: class F sortase [Bacillus]KEP26247.1 peptidase C60 [Bacillus zhangzhouensis]MDR0124050.1 class F sortase [Bacillus zhangzhouensis]PRO42177.1 class F sortase [Bacillus sp. LLTC93]
MKKWLVGILALLIITGCASHAMDESSSSETTSPPEKMTTNQAEKQSHSNDTLKGEPPGIVPAEIAIPAIDVKAKVEKTALSKDGSMGVPKHTDNTAWFEDGPKPGDKGNAVMNGHVDNKWGPSVFYRLKDLKKGDKVIVMSSSGKKRTFEVTKVQSYPREEKPNAFFGYAFTRNLNLITCTGTFDHAAGTHEKRLVVFTQLISS